jgi:hypothetical protein
MLSVKNVLNCFFSRNHNISEVVPSVKITLILIDTLVWSAYLTTIDTIVKFNSIYRIYSRISWEILNKIWSVFYPFDLYAGQQICLKIIELLFTNKISVVKKNECNNKILLN